MDVSRSGQKKHHSSVVRPANKQTNGNRGSSTPAKVNAKRSICLDSQDISPKKKHAKLYDSEGLESRLELKSIKENISSTKKSNRSSSNGLELFLCAQCRRVISNSLALVNTDEQTKAIVVSWLFELQPEDDVEVQLRSDKEDRACVWSPLLCQCRATLGKRYVSTTPEMDHLRGLFTLERDNILCYSPDRLEPVQEGGRPALSLHKVNETVRKLKEVVLFLTDQLEDLRAQVDSK